MQTFLHCVKFIHGAIVLYFIRISQVLQHIWPKHFVLFFIRNWNILEFSQTSLSSFTKYCVEIQLAWAGKHYNYCLADIEKDIDAHNHENRSIFDGFVLNNYKMTFLQFTMHNGFHCRRRQGSYLGFWSFVDHVMALWPL